MHTRSKYIDRIVFSELVYLTDSYSNSITENDFNLTTGKPLNNLLHNSSVDSFFIDTTQKTLFENKNINDDFIYSYPNAIELDSNRDLEIGDETNISVTFISEGASMMNMVGYYFYTIVDGEKKLLDNDGDIVDYYYKPTIIFPHVYSDDLIPTTLQTGNQRTLKGNLPNGNFKNIYVGFFLVPHGWFAYINNSPIYNENIFYSTLDFNIAYVSSEYEMVNDKIYSIFIKAKSSTDDELLLVGFEDIFITGTYNLDYNDCVIGITASIIENIINYNNFPEILIETNTENNNIIFIVNDGEIVRFPDDIYNINYDHYHIFERCIIYDNINERDEYYNIYTNLLKNYHLEITIQNNSVTNEYSVTSKYLFRPNDLRNSRKNGNKELYLLDIKHNKHINEYINNYRKIIDKNLNNQSYQEKYSLFDTELQQFVITKNENIDTPKILENNNFRIIGNGMMDTINGKTHLPFKNIMTYQVYKNLDNNNNGIVINIKMDDHPNGYQVGNKTFLRYASFVTNETEHVVIDLGDLSIYQEITDGLTVSDVNTLNNTLNNIHISDIQNGSDTIKNLASVFRNNSGATYRIITVNENYQFYCIRLYNVKNNPTMIYLNSNITQWGNITNNIGGTYYNKKLFPIINSFVTIL